MIRHPLLTSFPRPKRKRDGKKRERERKNRKIGKNTHISKVLLPLPPRAMVEQA
jgi:hypothetical protein